MATALVPSPRDDYETAAPFPHTVIDGFLDQTRAKLIAAEVQATKAPPEPDFYGSRGKSRLSDLTLMRQETRYLIEELNGPDFIAWLEGVTGIQGLQPDPELRGGGIHKMRRGGFLKLHTDFNWHDGLKLDRRLNLIVYLNEGWQDRWGGHLEMRRDMEGHGIKVAPLLNRAVIFSTTDHSYHGHPDPLACPEGVTRNSIALYYYSAGRPEGETRHGRSMITNYRSRRGHRMGLRHWAHQVMLGMPWLRRALRR